MIRLKIAELRAGHSAALGRNFTNIEIAEKLHQEGDDITKDYLEHLLSRWDKGKRLNTAVRYLPRLARLFSSPNIETLIAE